MPQSATIESIPQAFRMLKQMRAQEIEWGEDYRRAGALALKGVLERGMAARVDRHLEEMAERGCADRRNGSYGRWLMTELGEIELRVPRTRRFSALGVVRAYAQRSAPIDRMILACFVLGLSTRKVAVALQPVLGRRIRGMSGFLCKRRRGHCAFRTQRSMAGKRSSNRMANCPMAPVQ